MKQVDWTSYASEYDLMTANNPSYQALVNHCVRSVVRWDLKSGDTVGDFGAGTGNFSVALAKALPHIQVLHIDGDLRMLSIARTKAKAAGLNNWRAIALNLDDDKWPMSPLAGAISIHCIYSLGHPHLFIRNLCRLMLPGAHLYACDFGREMSVFDWGTYLLATSFRRHGIWRTATLFARCGRVRRQNRHVCKSQRAGVYWTHELTEFVNCFEDEGMTILEASAELYRGYDDLVIARKVERTDPA